jgi:hypothetical protein
MHFSSLQNRSGPYEKPFPIVTSIKALYEGANRKPNGAKLGGVPYLQANTPIQPGWEDEKTPFPPALRENHCGEFNSSRAKGKRGFLFPIPEVYMHYKRAKTKQEMSRWI